MPMNDVGAKGEIYMCMYIQVVVSGLRRWRWGHRRMRLALQCRVDELGVRC